MHPSSLKITKSYSISNKKTYEFIAKTKDLDTEVENHLHLVKIDGQPYMEVSMIEVDSEPTTEVEDNIGETRDEVVESEEDGKAEEVEAVEEETAESEW